ncbi:gamma-glutamylcyclotransferase [Sphingomonas sp. AOB5]|uniref:gamma-glutamylcyclotransferase family protein n=1 Tax=Sphingomonas sp. AOB5 TaxID=3034017 RepID=UPI0023F7DAB6|nr:gamma-glutamylcyclotransferase family protein [Sphingomonas sp. AOB5]MDF7774687.1 gamma-glutamylcyclotransferase [Sphingomonas sp. AOB5]
MTPTIPDPSQHGNAAIRLFSYGTLQLDNVQQMLFGRLVPMADDTLLGFESVTITITDPAVVGASGTETHLALVPAVPDAAIPGKTLEITAADLPAVDEYEGDNYRRVEVTLASGNTAFVYVKA